MERDRNRGVEGLSLSWASETSKLTPSDTLSLTRPHPLTLEIPLNSSTPWRPSIQIYECMGPLPILTAAQGITLNFQILACFLLRGVGMSSYGHLGLVIALQGIWIYKLEFRCSVFIVFG